MDRGDGLAAVSQRDRWEVMGPAGGALVIGNDKLERAGVAEWLAVAGVGDEDLSGVKVRVNLSERKYDGVAIRTGGDETTGERFSAKSASERCLDGRKQRGERNPGMSLCGVAMAVVHGHGCVREGAEVRHSKFHRSMRADLRAGLGGC